MNPEKPKVSLTPEERAERMVQAVLVGIDGSYHEYFLQHIREVIAEAYEKVRGGK